MNETGNRFLELFFEVYEALPRQGPGNRACAARALALCRELPPAPAVLDVGCGGGGQTLHLAELLPTASIVAIDSHAPLLARLKSEARKRGLDARLKAVEADMAKPGLPERSFDLVWSEGALYSIGLRKALRVCRGLLRPGGCLAFTDAVWRKDDPPAEVKAAFDADYPGMGRSEDVLAALADAGFDYVGGFLLPDEAWQDDFYTPMRHRIAELRRTYGGDAEALAALDEIAREPDMHNQHSDCYAYEFFVARLPEARKPGSYNGRNDLVS